jgi:hypothetical protein
LGEVGGVALADHVGLAGEEEEFDRVGGGGGGEEESREEGEEGEERSFWGELHGGIISMGWGLGNGGEGIAKFAKEKKRSEFREEASGGEGVDRLCKSCFET